MKTTVRFKDWGGPREVEVPDGANVQSLLDRFGFQANAVLVLRDGKPVPENAPAEDGAEYQVIVVASGG